MAILIFFLKKSAFKKIKYGCTTHHKKNVRGRLGTETQLSLFIFSFLHL